MVLVGGKAILPPDRRDPDEPEPSRGTPSLMDTYNKKKGPIKHDLHQNMMTDIAHASHHLDFLRTAEETNSLPLGLVVEPRMMLVFADKSTADEWKEQTKRNTLGYMKVAIYMRHYEKLLFYQLSNREIDILSKGLSYIPYNPLTNYVRDSDFTDFVRKLRLRYTYGHIPPSDPFKLQTKRTPGPTDYKPLETIIDRIALTYSQIKPTHRSA